MVRLAILVKRLIKTSAVIWLYATWIRFRLGLIYQYCCSTPLIPDYALVPIRPAPQARYNVDRIKKCTLDGEITSGVF
jgi:hypothetical protein